jgi:hypothetical protein
VPVSTFLGPFGAQGTASPAVTKKLAKSDLVSRGVKNFLARLGRQLRRPHYAGAVGRPPVLRTSSETVCVAIVGHNPKVSPIHWNPVPGPLRNTTPKSRTALSPSFPVLKCVIVGHYDRRREFLSRNRKKASGQDSAWTEKLTKGQSYSPKGSSFYPTDLARLSGSLKN